MLPQRAVSQPGPLPTIASALLSQDILVRLEDQRALGNLEPEAWATLLRVLDLIESCKVEGDPPTLILDVSEHRNEEKVISALAGLARKGFVTEFRSRQAQACETEMKVSHMNDNLTRAEQVAIEQSNEMRRKLEHSTPAQLGWPDLTAEELIATEYQCSIEAGKVFHQQPNQSGENK